MHTVVCRHANLPKKTTLHVFSRGICKTFQITYFEKHLWMATSEFTTAIRAQGSKVYLLGGTSHPRTLDFWRAMYSCLPWLLFIWIDSFIQISCLLIFVHITVWWYLWKLIFSKRKALQTNGFSTKANIKKRNFREKEKLFNKRKLYEGAKKVRGKF